MPRDVLCCVRLGAFQAATPALYMAGRSVTLQITKNSEDVDTDLVPIARRHIDPAVPEDAEALAGSDHGCRERCERWRPRPTQ